MSRSSNDGIDSAGRISDYYPDVYGFHLLQVSAAWRCLLTQKVC